MAEADNMAAVIEQRRVEIDKIENIMRNINDIAKDINIEVQNQGEKLDRLDNHMRTAADNVKEANKELKEASHHQKKSCKCLIYIIILAMVAIGVVLYFIISAFTKNKSEPPAPKAP